MNKISDFNKKKVFIYVLLITALVLVIAPLNITFNDIMTNLVMKLDVYGFIQNYIVPWELAMVAVILSVLGFGPVVVDGYLAITSSPFSGEVFLTPLLIEIAWNCVGWQSLIFFILTAFVGLQGEQYSNASKFRALLTGFLGTFLINLFRMAAVSVTALYLGQKMAIIFHDYGSILLNVLWLIFFWWFSYSYVLEERIQIKEVRRKV